MRITAQTPRRIKCRRGIVSRWQGPGGCATLSGTLRLIRAEPVPGHRQRGRNNRETAMGDVLAFKPRKPHMLGLCQHGFHAWDICKEKQFDVKAGKLVTAYQCSRCGAKKVKAT